MYDHAADTDEARADLGSRVLDQISPGWDRRIDLGTLDIADPYRCILCQLYGSFREGLDQLWCEEQRHHTLTALGVPPWDRSESQATSLGFAIVNFTQNVAQTAAWTRLIRARRAAQTPVA